MDTTDQVISVLPRQSLRARPAPGGGLVVESSEDARDWVRVDDDIVVLTRAVTRHLAADGQATSAFVDRAVAMAGVDVRSAGPVEAVVRAAYPLLGAVDPWPVPALPGSLPPRLRHAFRQRGPRAASRVLFGARATRPVTRATAMALTAAEGTIDVFRLTVAVAAATWLEPDHLVRLLSAPGPPAADRSGLDDEDAQVLGGLLGDLPVRRGLALLTSAMAVSDDRARLRHVVTAARQGEVVDMADVRTWRQASTRLALAVPDLGARLPGGPADPQVRAVPHPAWSLHPAQSGRDLVRLSRVLDNCLDTYVGRLGRHERIIEVRDADGRTCAAVHVRRGQVQEFRGPHNRLPNPRQRREVVANLEAGGWLGGAEAGPDVDVSEPAIVALSRELLGPDRVGRVDWAELGAVLWLGGLLRDLPEPTIATSERVVRDVAELVVAGRLGELPRTPRSHLDLQAAMDRLGPAAVVWTAVGWRRRMMLDVVAAAARRAGR